MEFLIFRIQHNKTIPIILLTATTLWGSGIVSGDVEYYKLFQDKANYNYSIDNKDTLEKNSIYVDNLINEYEKSYGYKLKEPLIINIASQNNQIANAYSTILPFNLVTFYGAGALNLDYSGYTSWYKNLASHEIAHTFQINAQNELQKDVSNFTGTFPMPVIPIPYFTYSNVFLPKFILEGNSVLNESLIDNGGRLYAYEPRTIFYALLQAGLLTKEKVINADIAFPYGKEPYVMGGFFAAYLATKFGVEKTNQFFKHNASFDINPFLLNLSFSQHFGLDFEQLYQDFLNTYKSGLNQKILDGNIIKKSQQFISFNDYEDEIFFLTSDMKSAPILHILSKTFPTLQSSVVNMSFGKVFKLHERYFSASSNYIDTNKYITGLFDEEQNLFLSTKSKILQDISEYDELLYFDTQNSFDQPSLYFDGVFLTKANSSAMLDEKNNVYYFKQNGQIRELYKNKKLLYSFEGYSSKIADVVGDEIYFIANTQYGSSLFMYKNSSVIRVNESDNIVDFKKLKDGGLYATIRGDGYYIIKAPLQKLTGEPYVVKYEFEKNKYSIESIEQNIDKLTQYSPIWELNYSHSYLSLYADLSTSLQTNLNINFSDQLSLNSVDLSLYTNASYITSYATYTNTESLFNYTIGAIDQYSFSSNSDIVLLNLSSTYNFRKGRNLFSAAVQTLFGDSLYVNTLSSEYTTSLYYGYSYDYNFISQISFYLQNTSSHNSLTYKYRLQNSYPYEFFLNLTLKGALADNSKIYIGPSSNASSLLKSNLLIDTLSSVNTNFANKATWELMKVINQDFYYFNLPLSFRRAAIMLGGDYVYYDLKYLYEHFISLESEMLVFHDNTAKLNLKLYTTSQNNSGVSISLWANY